MQRVHGVHKYAYWLVGYGEPRAKQQWATDTKILELCMMMYGCKETRPFREGRRKGRGGGRKKLYIQALALFEIGK